MAACVVNGFVPGFSYQINTCHSVIITDWEIPLARHCELSNIFKLVKAEES